MEPQERRMAIWRSLCCRRFDAVYRNDKETGTIGTTNQVQSVVMPASSALHFWLLSYTRQETAKEVMM